MNIVIVGGGFGGIKAALELSRHPWCHVTLISDKDHFLYYPALYKVATGGARKEAVISLYKIFENTAVKVVTDTISDVDEHRRIVIGQKKQYQYDRLILALGVVTNFFGIPGLKEYSYNIKSQHGVDEFKDHLHALAEIDKHMDRHYVIVGGGPTGVELAAALASYLKFIAHNHQVRKAKIRIELIEAAPRVLPRMTPRASEKVRRRLTQLGVTVRVNRRVEGQDPESLTVSGKKLPTHSVVWTSGVANHPFYARHPHVFQLAPNGKVKVDDHLQAAHHIYVIGDNAATQWSGLAQTALHDADYVASDIEREHEGHERPQYHVHVPPVVVPVGENWAVLEWRGLVITGWLAGIIRRAADLIGYHDVLSMGKALSAWVASLGMREEACETCKNR